MLDCRQAGFGETDDDSCHHPGSRVFPIAIQFWESSRVRPILCRNVSSGGQDYAEGVELPVSGGLMTNRSVWRWLAYGTGVSLAAFAILIAIGMHNAQSKPIVRRITMHMAGLSDGSRPIKVALLADIHLGNTAMTQTRLTDTVEQINASRPDLILLAGDFVTGHDAERATDRAAGLTQPLARLRAPFGVIAVLGNHDYWTAPTAVRTALSRAGVTVLENQVVRRGPFAIIGIGDRFSGHDNVPSSLIAARRIGGVPIVLTHSPDLVPDLPVDQPLVLAGHTHCGQVVLPWIGPLVMHAPSDHWRQLYNPRYRCGIVRDGTRTTIVTAGVGSGTSPIRIGAMPDWWLITLEP